MRAIALLHPQTALAFVGRWDDEGHLSLDITVAAAAAALAESGFLTPSDSMVLLGLSGEETNPVRAATAVLDQMPQGPARAAALSELSLRIRRDLLPNTRAGAAQSLHKWATQQGIAGADAVRALEPLLTATEEHRTSRPWATSAESDRDERKRAVDEIVRRAEGGDPAALDGDLRALAKLFAADQISRYLTAVAEAVIPSRRADLVDALAALPADHPIANFHAEDILDALARAAMESRGSAALRARCANAIARVLETHFEAMTRYQGNAERVVATVLSLGCLDDPAGHVLRAVGASLERLSPRALYGTACELALTLEREERAELLRWSLTGLETEPAAVPDLPEQREEVLAALFWSLFAAPDKATRWRAAHVARRLITAGDELLTRALFERAETRDGGAFAAPGLPFYWHSARVWTLMVIARIARDRPAAVADLAPQLAAIAGDQSWPHVAVREFARRGALRIVEKLDGQLPEPVADELRFANAPRTCNRDREWLFSHRQHSSRDYETERFHFDPIDTLPYVYRPLGERFGLDVDEVCKRAERWMVDRLGLSSDRVRDPRVERMDYSLSYASHGSSPRVESWRQALESHALQLVAGELCDQGVPIRVDSGEDPCDPWAEVLRDYIDSLEFAWIADERTPVPPVPALLMTDIGPNNWPQLNDSELERAIGAFERETLVVDVSVSLTAEFGYGSTYVTSALVSPQAAPALVRALEATAYPLALPVERGYNRDDQDDIDEGEFQLQGWLWVEHHENEGLEKHDPLARIGLTVTRPGSAFLAACGGTPEAGGGRVRRPDGELVAWQHSWSDITWTEDGRRESHGTHGRETRVRRDALCEMLRATGSLLILQASATRHRSGRDHREEESSDQRTQRTYLFDPDRGLTTVDGPVEAR